MGLLIYYLIYFIVGALLSFFVIKLFNREYDVHYYRDSFWPCLFIYLVMLFFTLPFLVVLSIEKLADFVSKMTFHRLDSEDNPSLEDTKRNSSYLCGLGNTRKHH